MSPLEHREQLAYRNGFGTVSELLEASHELPLLIGQETPSYLTRHPAGYWFLWQDEPLREPAD